jgi:hypothetical protein
VWHLKVDNSVEQFGKAQYNGLTETGLVVGTSDVAIKSAAAVVSVVLAN